MKNKKCFSILNMLPVLLLLPLLLSGCQLAKETGSTAAGSKDQLCGVFVTLGYQELPVNQDTLQDVNFIVDSGGKLVFDQKELDSAFTNTVEGVRSDDGSTIKFNGLKGYYMGMLHQDSGGEDSVVYMGDTGFHDTKYAVNKTDDGEIRSCESTLSVSTKFQDIVNINPVYIRNDGTYYTVLGQNVGMSFTGSSAGTTYNQTFDNSYTTAIDGKTTTEKESFKVNICVVDETKQVFIKEMNQNDGLVKTTQFFRDDPEEFNVDPNTAYVIVEETMENGVSGRSYIKRSIYSLDKKNDVKDNVIHICNYVNDNYVIGTTIIRFVY